MKNSLAKFAVVFILIAIIAVTAYLLVIKKASNNTTNEEPISNVVSSTVYLPDACNVISKDTIFQEMGLSVDEGSDIKMTSSSTSCHFDGDDGIFMNIEVTYADKYNPTKYSDRTEFNDIAEKGFISKTENGATEIEAVKGNIVIKLNINDTVGNITDVQMKALMRDMISEL